METNTTAGFLPGLFPQMLEGKLGEGFDDLSAEALGIDQQSFVDIMQGLDPSQIVQAVGDIDTFTNPELMPGTGEMPMLTVKPGAGTDLPESGKALPQMELAQALTAQLNQTGQQQAALQPAATPVTQAELNAAGIDITLTAPESSEAELALKADGGRRQQLQSQLQPVAAEADTAELDQQTLAIKSEQAGKQALTQQAQQGIEKTLPQQQTLTTGAMADLQQQSSRQQSDSQSFIGLKPLQGDAMMMSSGMASGNGADQFQQQGQGTKADLITSQMLNMERQLPPEQRFTLAPLSSAAPTSANPAQLEVTTPFNSAGWDKAFNQQIMFMAGRDIQAARIQLNPQQLGAIHVELTISDEKNSVTFHAQNDGTREAIEQALPRLRAMFESQGMQLNDAQVSDSFNEQEQADAFREKLAQQQQNRDGAEAGDQDDDEQTVVMHPVDDDDSLLDHYV